VHSEINLENFSEERGAVILLRSLTSTIMKVREDIYRTEERHCSRAGNVNLMGVGYHLSLDIRPSIRALLKSQRGLTTPLATIHLDASQRSMLV